MASMTSDSKKPLPAILTPVRLSGKSLPTSSPYPAENSAYAPMRSRKNTVNNFGDLFAVPYWKSKIFAIFVRPHKTLTDR
jgi:hypothetical protein